MEIGKTSLGNSRRTKKWATKTRTGCATCRRRRIKCDEGVPSCTRCISTGRDCEGYRHDATSHGAACILAVYHEPVQSNAPAGVDASHAERSAFAMLHGECVRRMAGLFSESFWTIDVMRATQVYPAIWHAGLAMAAMHRATCITAPTPQARASRQRHEAFSLSQFNAAVRSVLELTKKPALSDADKETILLASTLFTGLCCLQENYEQASRHAKGGNRLYWRWKYWKQHDGDEEDGPDDDDDNDKDTDLTCTTENYRADYQGSRRSGCVLTTKSLTAVFTHFEMQFCSRFRTVDIPEWRWRNKAHKCSAAPFASAVDAYTELQPLLTGYCHLGRYLSIPRDVAELEPVWRSVKAYVGELLAWKAKFDDLLARLTMPPPDEEEAYKILCLRLLWMTLEMSLSQSDGTGEMVWDARGPDMERVTAFAETHFAARCQPSSGPRSFTFSFAMSVCEVLTFLGTNCRDGGIRRRLIALLHGWRERDGMMDARLLALLVHTVMVLEENALNGMQAPHEGCTCVPGGRFICNDHRVCLIDTQFLGERSATIVLTTAGMLKNELPPYETSVSW
ncbi:Zn(2)-C6 fungal-type DNA-binding domain protein [Akanthomyces lecanii RCEF 1005]|uniref:Zn(2)-C6 fungal-type DNA-binding domain protein n=1 Tax=Akanthomyces lecanii RCEF 1005 TaxID=1081108 RepID=A0A168IJD6_CORDF|nr:Zn(2)-C6 fungal-type DNA-binding domain protein [Akanthomyces lecanii RCEF 1005]